MNNNTITTEKTYFLVIKFKISGSLRFLSHSQMLNVFHRACIRAELNLQYSQGFNPRPKISLPLPRPVGIESDDELIVIPCIDSSEQSFLEDSDDNQLALQSLQALSVQLPDSCKLISAQIVLKKTPFQPCEASYIFTIDEKYFDKNLQNKIDVLLNNESLFIERPIGNKGKARERYAKKSEQNQSRENISTGNLKSKFTKKIDIRSFLISIVIKQNCIIIKYRISPEGSIRINEIMDLLDLNIEYLACPIKRTNVKWQEDK